MVYWDFLMSFRFWWRVLLLLGALLLSVGFNVYPGVKGWSLDSSLTAGRKVFVTLSTSGRTMTNDMPASDSLASSASPLTEAQILTSILADYNSVSGSNLILAMDSDSDFAGYSKDHQIYIADGTASGVNSGEAKITSSNKYITECKITLTEKAYASVKAYVQLVTHELGHCMGLEHPQETVWSIMSYFYNDDVFRLAIDDKMGLVHLYGSTSDARDEKPTYGMSCSRR
jgi:hypothetical protein